MVYRFALMDHLAALGGAGVRAPSYVKAWVLRGQPLAAVAATAWENVLSAPALPVTLAAVGLVAWPFVKRSPQVQRWPGASSFPAVATMAVVAQVLSAAISARGSYPWHFAQKWSLYLHGLSMLCAVYLGAFAWWSAESARGPVPRVPVLAIAIVLTVHAAAYRRTVGDDLAPALERLNAMSPSLGSVLVTHHQIPTVRYLYELGPFRGDARYPAAFRFERRVERDAQSPIHAAQECLEYIVSPLGLDELAMRLPGSRLTPVPDVVPPHLIGIDTGNARPPHCSGRRTATSRVTRDASYGARDSSAGDRPTTGSPGWRSNAHGAASAGPAAESRHRPR